MNKLPSKIVGLVIILACAPVLWAAEPLATITVDAGPYDRLDTPVLVSLDGVPVGPGQGAFVLVEGKGFKRKTYPAQLEAGSPPRLWFLLPGETRAGTKRTFSLAKTGKAKRAAVTIAETDKHLDIIHRGDKVLRYNHAIVPPPEGYDKLYERSGFIHPLWSTSGAVLTAMHPEDHIHHFGIWMPWTRTEFEGKTVNFWEINRGQGTVRFNRFVSTTRGPVYGGFQAEQEHVVLKTDDGEKTVLNEVWDVRVFSVGGRKKGYRICDFVSTQRCVAESPLLQKRYHYSGFGFRAAPEWKGENTANLTSEGKTQENGNGTRARWCDASGKIDEWEGITFYSHPENFRHPEPMRIWPPGMVGAFFNFCPSVMGDWEMKPGEDHVFRYRMYVHEGKITVPVAERIWRDYAEPPKVTIDPVIPGGAIMLLAGEKLSEYWEPADEEARRIAWKFENGIATVAPETGSIQTKEDFTDFRMHLEFCTPDMPSEAKGQDRGNSGVYIQRRYEVQILDSSEWELKRQGRKLRNNDCGSLYSRKPPDKNVCKLPGQWQSYDIIFRAAKFRGDKKKKDARITVWHNGVMIHDDFEILNKTGAGNEEGPDPGPILLQDHENKVKFRNIWIVPL
ncbi:MAG: DUF6807 family protein [Planctomycetota bacterium]|jgi:hypothetical protein